MRTLFLTIIIFALGAALTQAQSIAPTGCEEKIGGFVVTADHATSGTKARLIARNVDTDEVTTGPTTTITTTAPHAVLSIGKLSLSKTPYRLWVDFWDKPANKGKSLIPVMIPGDETNPPRNPRTKPALSLAVAKNPDKGSNLENRLIAAWAALSIDTTAALSVLQAELIRVNKTDRAEQDAAMDAAVARAKAQPGDVIE